MSELVEAEIIDDEQPTSELRIIKAEPGSAIISNIGAVKAWVDGRLATYSVPDIADEAGYRQAKRDRASLRKVGTTVDDERKRIKGIYEAPLKDFEAQVRTITDPVKALDAKLKEQIDGYEDAQRQKRRAVLEAHYADFAPLLVPNVPYERLHDDAWLNATVSITKAMDELDAKVQTIASTYEQLCDMELAHPIEVKARYFETLDLAAALRYDKELTDRQRAASELEDERQAITSESAAEPATGPESDKPVGRIKVKGRQVDVYRADKDEPDEQRRTVWFEFADVTDGQVQGIINYCRDNGIHGKRVSR